MELLSSILCSMLNIFMISKIHVIFPWTLNLSSRFLNSFLNLQEHHYLHSKLNTEHLLHSCSQDFIYYSFYNIYYFTCIYYKIFSFIQHAIQLLHYSSTPWNSAFNLSFLSAQIHHSLLLIWFSVNVNHLARLTSYTLPNSRETNWNSLSISAAAPGPNPQLSSAPLP